MFAALKRPWRKTTFLLILCVCLSLLWLLYYERKQKMRQIPPFYPILPIAERRRRIGGGSVNNSSTMKLKKNRPGLQLNVYSPEILSESMSSHTLEINFFNYLEHKSVLCHNNRRLGNQHDGGWNVCYSPPFNISKPCLVYAFGIGNDWRFEDDMFDLHGCQVMAYDPSIDKEEHNRTDGVWFKPIGLGSPNSRKARRKKWKTKTFEQIQADEGHAQVLIDYLKFDIEFMEWEVIPELVKGHNSLLHVKQLGFEIHLRDPLNKSALKTPIDREDFIEKYNILRLLEKAGFRKFDYRLNPFCTYLSPLTGESKSWCYELFYINMKFVSQTHFET